MEKGLPPGETGIKVASIGPWKFKGSDGREHIQYVFLPAPTDQCDLCVGRVGKGKQPTCVKHCMSQVIGYGALEDMTPLLGQKAKLVLYTMD
jgi:anaerobic dimethyl sulfoxide reductase subunit B (iron-sulfur subunit)